MTDIRERVYSFYKDHKFEIEDSDQYDGTYYILKNLYKALYDAVNSFGCTVTIHNEEDLLRNRIREDKIDSCIENIMKAICEVIDSHEDRQSVIELMEQYRDERDDI